MEKNEERIVAIKNNIETIMKARGWNMSDLAKATGMYATQVQGHLHRNLGISAESLIRYADALGCDMNAIFDGATDLNRFKEVRTREDMYPYNLILKLFKDEADPINIDNLYLPRFYKAFDELTAREKTVIEDIHIHNMTLDDIGKKFGVTRERIRQIEAKACRKLRHRAHSIQYGFIFDIDDLLTKIQELKEENHQLKMYLESAGKVADFMKDEMEKANLIPIDTIELSVRAYNILKRAGFRYVSDFNGVSIDKLMGLRNMGKKTLNEIIEKLKAYGYVVVEREENAS